MAMLDPIGKLFKDSWNLYKRYLDDAVKVFILPVVLLAIGQLATPLAILRLVGYLFFLVSTVAYISLLDHGGDSKSAYRDGWRVFWPFLWLGIINFFAVLGGFIMVIIPGILISVWLLFANFVFVLENKRGVDALVKSKEYVKGYWWPLFGRYILLALVVGVSVGIVSGVFTGLFGRHIGAFVSSFALLFASPFSLAYGYSLFANVRSLKSQATAEAPAGGRKFIIASAIVGFIVPVILFVFFAGLIVTAIIGGMQNAGSGNPGTYPPIYYH